MARPRPRLAAGERRTRTISVRVTEAQAAELAERAAGVRMSMAAYMRSRSLGQPVRVTTERRLAAIERVELTRIGVNLNQVARALNTGATAAPAGTREAVERVGELAAALLVGEV